MTTKHILGALGGIGLVAGLSAGQPARDCWAVSNMKGYSAFSAEAYKFAFEVYQLDRERKKLMYTKARVGTGSMLPGAPDVVSAFIGDAEPVRQ